VARRICAAPGTEDYGAFSVFCQYHADCAWQFDVPPDCFHPAPKVTSSVIRLDTREGPPVPVSNPGLFFRVVRGSFAQRRKTLQNGLTAAFGGAFTKDDLGAVLETCGFSKNVRGETLGIPEFARIAETLENFPKTDT
jgi:16S rRNA (adenine1518-N6/adenine1519-N6)-dimethyltransferase